MLQVGVVLMYLVAAIVGLRVEQVPLLVKMAYLASNLGVRFLKD
jgi:hypothetical protein